MLAQCPVERIGIVEKTPLERYVAPGVPSLVVSQWKVESAGTRELMVNFHRGLISPTTRTTKSEALREAALKLLKNPETNHPFYWAGFVLVGEGN